jgi:hypothetical protein
VSLLKPLKPGQSRYIAKVHSGSGKSAVWGVYDVQMASFPRTVVGYGQVPEGLKEAEARIEAEKVERWRVRNRA